MKPLFYIALHVDNSPLEFCFEYDLGKLPLDIMQVADIILDLVAMTVVKDRFSDKKTFTAAVLEHALHQPRQPWSFILSLKYKIQGKMKYDLHGMPVYVHKGLKPHQAAFMHKGPLSGLITNSQIMIPTDFKAYADFGMDFSKAEAEAAWEAFFKGIKPGKTMLSLKGMPHVVDDSEADVDVKAHLDKWFPTSGTVDDKK